MLQPKKTKYRKMQKGRMRGHETRGVNFEFGSFLGFNVCSVFI